MKIPNPSVLQALDKKSHSTISAVTYNELSQQFKALYPTILQAFQLIGQMYNQLTLVNRLTHAEAIKKIYDDHRDLQGFSRRNIYRYLPPNNPHVPKRVVSPRHKSSHTESVTSEKFSAAKLFSHTEETSQSKIYDVQSKIETSEGECRRCMDLAAKNEELEQALLAISGCKRANNLIGNEIVYQIPKEKRYLLIEALEKSDTITFIAFNETGKLIYAEADIERMKRVVSNNSKN